MRVYVEQHGCATTSAEKREIEASADAAGHTLVDRVEDADAVALVTCAVLEGTEQRMLNRVEELAEADVEVMVGGCLTPVRPEAIRDRAPGAELLAADETDPFGGGELPMADRRVDPGPTEEFVIASGCTSSCTFCATKQARGDVDSRPLGEVVGQVRRAVEAGTCEVYLTSQDTADYGADKGPGASRLPDLVEAVADLPGRFRARVGMMNPAPASGIVDGLSKALAREKVYTFLHLPVQSGSDDVLARMGRRHRVEAFREIVATLREDHPELMLATDVICGFPGETDADHEATVELIEAVRPEMVNITRFSKRPGTPAADMDDQVPSQVRKARSGELTEVCRRVREARLGDRVGRTVRVLWVEDGAGTGVIGRTDAYRPVRVEEPGRVGTVDEVEIVGVDGVHLVGERV